MEGLHMWRPSIAFVDCPPSGNSLAEAQLFLPLLLLGQSTMIWQFQSHQQIWRAHVRQRPIRLTKYGEENAVGVRQLSEIVWERKSKAFYTPSAILPLLYFACAHMQAIEMQPSVWIWWKLRLLAIDPPILILIARSVLRYEYSCEYSVLR